MAFLDKLLRKSTGSTGRNWTIGKRIKIMTLVGAAITLLVGVISIYSLNKIEDNSTKLEEQFLPVWSSTSALMKKVRRTNYYFFKYHNSQTNSMYQKAISHFNEI